MASYKILAGKIISKTFDLFGLGQDKYEGFIFLLNKLIYPTYFRVLPKNKLVTRNFSKLFYIQSIIGGTWNQSKWLGRRILKNPLDLFIYQEIIYEIKPDVIVETGTSYGGSALFFASILDLIGKGKVITNDIHKPRPFTNRRITFLHGSSVDMEIFKKIKKLIGRGEKVIVILDSDHRKEHVFRELEMYSKLVSVGSYLIVEDTNLNGNPVRDDFGPGPNEAVAEFMGKQKSFAVDKKREKFLMTHNPGGFLKRVR